MDIEVLEEANQFMKDRYLVSHPLHKEKETDLGQWKARSETILHKNSTLWRVFECPMKKQFGCKVQVKIEEGPGGLLMCRCGWHDGDSHAKPEDQVPVTRFLRCRSLVDESDMPRPFLEKSLHEKGNKPDGQPEYIILEEEGLPEHEEVEDDDGYVKDVLQGPCVYVPDLGVYVSEHCAGRLCKFLLKHVDYEHTHFTREVICRTQCG